MTGAPAILAELLAQCEAHGIRLALGGDDGLTIDAPQDALTPDLLARLKAHKADVLAVLRAAPEAAPIDLADARAVWLAALDRLESDPLFSPEVLEALRVADAHWSNAPEATESPLDAWHDPTVVLDPRPAGSDVERFPIGAKRCDSTNRACRCGGTTWRDVAIHGGQSVRRDCGRCGRFRDFPVWYAGAGRGQAVASSGCGRFRDFPVWYGQDVLQNEN